MRARVWTWDEWAGSQVIHEVDLTERVLKQALVECECGLPHDSIWHHGGWHCRYARGNVTHTESGLVIKGTHACHECNGYFCLPALTPIEERVCDNCGGPAAPTHQPSVFPDLLMLEDFPSIEG